MRKPIAVSLAALLLTLTSSWASAGDFGTREQAEALLQRAVAMLNPDKARALDLFTSGDGGFIDRDLYVFCGGPDGMLTAHPYLMGVSLKGFEDKAGKAAGEEFYAVAAEGAFTEVSYSWLRPGSGDEAVDKTSFITKVGDQVCGVGYYTE